MWNLFELYWPHILATLSILMGLAAAIHATMTKREVRAAIGWVGVIILSPILGAVIYGLFGINRVRRRSILLQRHTKDIEHLCLADYDIIEDRIEEKMGRLAVSMYRLGNHVSRCQLTSGNHITLLENGDEAYKAMLAAIDAARRSIILESYIFGHDDIGLRFVDSLAKAQERGVEIRILIDAVGARYSIPSIIWVLRNRGINARLFNGKLINGLKLPYANLRTHRKILVVDGQVAFTGGMNIRSGFVTAIVGDNVSYDTHFRVEGPVVADLFRVAAEDWAFTTSEKLQEAAFAIQPPLLKPDEGVAIRVVSSGPDKTIETNQKMLMGAFSLAQNHIRIMTPYLLPDRELVSAIVTAARRGVKVDIVVPSNNNLKLVDRAMQAQFDQLLGDHCRIWRAKGNFDHSKLITIDGLWSYVGSSNLDARSLRLNFEVDLEIFDAGFASAIEARIEARLKNAIVVDMQQLKKRPFISRLVDRIIWLGSPYL